MNRDLQLKNRRKKFVKLADADINKASDELFEIAKALKNCSRTSDKIFALSQIFCVSESTIEKDLYSD